MAVTFLAGNRAVGTSAERLSTFTANPAGWVQLGRTTLTAENANIDVTSLSSKRYYMILTTGASTSSIADGFLQFGDSSFDIGLNYSARVCAQGGAEVLRPDQNKIIYDGNTNLDVHTFGVGYLSNFTSKEKLYNGWFTGQTSQSGASIAPMRGEATGKWANTSSPITRIRALSSAGAWMSGAELVVLGYDPADTHTNNFWTELASASVSSGDELSSGVFSAKKYLWIQAFTKNNGSAIRSKLQVGNTTIDTGNNYSVRRNDNGGTEHTFAPTDFLGTSSGAVADTEFWNVFIANVSGKEKLCIYHVVRSSTAGAGNAPTRNEGTGKWIVSNQINIIRFFNDQAGDYASGTTMKVWGSD